MGFTDTYHMAVIRCSSSNGTILNIDNNLFNLDDGKEYWSNIYRSKFLKWVTNESFDEICCKFKCVTYVLIKVYNIDSKTFNFGRT